MSDAPPPGSLVAKLGGSVGAFPAAEWDALAGGATPSFPTPS